MRILFICLGNICRSPMAEFLTRDLACKAGLSQRLFVASAATSAEELGNSVYPPARQLLARHGIDCSAKRARRLQAADYGRFDLLVAMERANLRAMGRILGGDPEGKFRLLLDYTPQGGDVADPWYTGDFETAWRDIEAGCRGLLHALFPHQM